MAKYSFEEFLSILENFYWRELHLLLQTSPRKSPCNDKFDSDIIQKVASAYASIQASKIINN